MNMSKIIIDDTNPNIEYSGAWFTASNSQINIGNNGPPFQNTLHGVNVNASFSYSFSGSEVIVLGASLTTNSSGTQDPTWECFVDNVSIGWHPSAGARTQNSWVFCQSFLQDGPHVLSTKVTVLHQQTFWFDRIHYVPSSNVALDNATVLVDSTDPAVQYSSGWTVLNGIVNSTQTAGSTVTYEFFGVSLSWSGFVPTNFSLTPSSGIYSIDGQTPISFFVPAFSAANASAPSLYNQVLFKTPTLSPGKHKLVVTYQGNSGTAPLALDAFIVQNATSPSTTASSVPSTSSTSNLSSKKSPLVGVIITVGVVGGAIVLVLLLFIYIRRRNNRRPQRPVKNSILADEIDPFPSSHNNISEVPSLTQPLLSFASKASRRRFSSNAPSSSRPTPPPVIEAGISSSMQPSTSAEGGDDLGFLRHEDSGVRIPHAEDNLDELPPVYTMG